MTELEYFLETNKGFLVGKLDPNNICLFKLGVVDNKEQITRSKYNLSTTNLDMIKYCRYFYANKS